MPVPLEGVPSALRQYLQDLEARLGAVESPQGPTGIYQMTSTQLTSANAKEHVGRAIIVTNLKTWAWSDGVHWYRTDTGATIV